jgi:hypothetical protein
MTVPTAATNHECKICWENTSYGICISSNVGVAMTSDDDEEESIDGMVTAECQESAVHIVVLRRGFASQVDMRFLDVCDRSSRLLF